MDRSLTMSLALIVILVVAISTFATMETFVLSSPATALPAAPKKPFYVGVTYCGDNVTGAEQLIDQVKSYTNLFVIQSGPLMSNLTSMEQICDYAVNAGLNIIVYYSSTSGTGSIYNAFLAEAQSRWGSHFLGLYYNDEPGGKMLDTSVQLYDNQTGESIGKGSDGSVSVTADLGQFFFVFYPSGEITAYYTASSNQTIGEVGNVTDWTSKTIIYYPNGTITRSLSSSLTYPNGTWVDIAEDPITYEPNGTVISESETIRTGPSDDFLFSGSIFVSGTTLPPTDVNETTQPITDQGNISQFEPYQQLWNTRPIQTPAEAATVYVDTEQNILSSIGNQSDVRLFTSDYALDSYDYQAGYDVVLGELGWNQSFTQDIDMVRGAADMAGKSWGTMIDWASQTPPTLLSGSQMYNAMKESYESGAEYVVVFNYVGNQQTIDINGTVGLYTNQSAPTSNCLLQASQFAAIQKFWNQVVENPKITNNVTAQDALVLPANYGGGMRSADDGTWGIWQANSTTQQVWNTLEKVLNKYGSKLDIIYDDPAYPTAGRYQNVVYWNQTA